MGSAPMSVLARPPIPSCVLVAAVGERVYILIIPKGLIGACENSNSQRKGLRKKQTPTETTPVLWVEEFLKVP